MTHGGLDVRAPAPDFRLSFRGGGEIKSSSPATAVNRASSVLRPRVQLNDMPRTYCPDGAYAAGIWELQALKCSSHWATPWSTSKVKLLMGCKNHQNTQANKYAANQFFKRFFTYAIRQFGGE